MRRSACPRSRDARRRARPLAFGQQDRRAEASTQSGKFRRWAHDRARDPGGERAQGTTSARSTLSSIMTSNPARTLMRFCPARHFEGRHRALRARRHRLRRPWASPPLARASAGRRPRERPFFLSLDASRCRHQESAPGRGSANCANALAVGPLGFHRATRSRHTAAVASCARRILASMATRSTMALAGARERGRPNGCHSFTDRLHQALSMALALLATHCSGLALPLRIAGQRGPGHAHGCIPPGLVRLAEARGRPSEARERAADHLAACRARAGPRRLGCAPYGRRAACRRRAHVAQARAAAHARQGLRAAGARRFRATTDSNHAEPVAPNVLARDSCPPGPTAPG